MLQTHPIFCAACEVIERHPVGVLTTVDRNGNPHARWMTGTLLDDASHVYCLTAADSRKVEHIRANPVVCWLFTSPDHQEVVTLRGSARVLQGPDASTDLWLRIAERQQSFYVVPEPAGPQNELVGIRTSVQAIELLSPHAPSSGRAELNLRRAA